MAKNNSGAGVATVSVGYGPGRLCIFWVGVVWGGGGAPEGGAGDVALPLAGLGAGTVPKEGLGAGDALIPTVTTGLGEGGAFTTVVPGCAGGGRCLNSWAGGGRCSDNGAGGRRCLIRWTGRRCHCNYRRWH